MKVTLPAFAKINLSLRVGERRADGFHEVRTVLQTITLADRIACESRRGPFEIVCTAKGIPTDRTNLVWKAAQSLWHSAGREGPPRDARVRLEKNIPAGAGLGGGSSDAAAALFALRRVWRLRTPDPTLRELAAGIGSDVPYFFVGGTALALGRGEEVYALEDLPRLPLVLIFPSFGISTTDAYQWLDDSKKGTGTFFPETGLKKVPVPFFGINDFEPAVIARHPVIERLKSRLLKAGASMAAMSGSGSTVFGVFTTAGAARVAAGMLRRTGANAVVAAFQPRARRSNLPVSPSIV